MSTDWPFGDDADRDDPLTTLRVPAVWSFNPMWRYVAAYIKPHAENPYHWASTERPTDAEAAMLASFINEYLGYYFHAGYIEKLRRRPLDVDSGCNTTLFIKYGPNDWGYRMASWERGSMFVPTWPRSRGAEHDDTGGLGPLTLVQVMDRRHTIADTKPMQHWADWKALHPEVFPA